MSTTPPAKKDVSHMFDGPDDSSPIKKLCSGWVKRFDLTQEQQRYNIIASSMPVLIPVGLSELTLKVTLLGNMNNEVAQMLLAGECDILVRPHRRNQ